MRSHSLLFCVVSFAYCGRQNPYVGSLKIAKSRIGATIPRIAAIYSINKTKTLLV